MMRRWLSLLLRLTPRQFRERSVGEILGVHDARARAVRSRSVLERAWFALYETAGIVRLVFGVRRVQHGSAVQRRERAHMFETLRQDVRFGLRTLSRNPGFALAGVAVLALGIGANAAIFSVANAYLFRPLPFGAPDRLMMLYETNPEFGWTHAQVAPANFLDWREGVDAFDDIAMYTEFVNRVPYVREGEPALLELGMVSGNFFDVLGVRMVLGRSLRFEETWQGRDAVVVLNHEFWASHFGADPTIVGTTVEFGATSVEIAGIAPPGFEFPVPGVQAWSTWGWDEAARTAVWFRRAHWGRAIARLAPGVSPEEANAQFQVVVRRLQEEYPETNRVMGAGMLPVRDYLIRDVRTTLWILLGAVALLLLLACANVANLVLVRATDRTRELALRHALGAGRGRVARLLVMESLLLALGGGIVGLGLGWVGVRLVARADTIGIWGATALALDHRVVLFTALVASASAVLFGLVPAFRAATVSVQTALKEGGRGGSPGARSNRAAGVLVAVEIALALLLVAAAGLMIRSFVMLQRVDPGFRTDGVLAVQFTVPGSRYPNRNQVLAFQDRFIEALEARPGIERAGLVGRLPLDGTSWSSQFQAEGWPADRVGFEILHRRADRGYFDALGIPLLRGRLFDSRDGPDAPLVVVINETLAREHFPGEDPIGQKIAYDRAATPESFWYEIIGIVGDQQQQSPRVPARAEVFENRNQDWDRNEWIVMRTTSDPLSVLPVVRATLRELDPLIPIAAARPIREVWRTSMARDQLMLSLLGVFGAVALLLAAAGVYGVTAQAARKRTQEIGIRMALGAGNAQVLSLMLRRGLLLVGVGLVTGVLGALVLSRTVASIVFGVEPTDPATLATVVGFLGGVAALACWLPAWRATRVDPVRSLRAE
ncbi:MAG: ABC transporter permease [Gemmatimonadetes bacterium]|nr:ABC transporter permease [Gemmatimonadota bacterium]